MSFLVSGCSYFATNEANADNYSIALSEAKISIYKAIKADNEWRDSRKILDQSIKAAEAGDFAKAIKLANQAGRQGELAFAQSESQKNAGPIQ